MQTPHSPDPYLTVYKSDRTAIPNGKNGATLVNGTTYYVPFGGEDALKQAVQLQWDNAIILTSVEVEFSINPDADVVSAVAGEWVKENVANSFGAGYATAGGVMTVNTLAVAGGTAGGALWELSSGALKGRLKIVVGGTGGVIKPMGHGKA